MDSINTQVTSKAITLARQVVEMTTAAGSGHPSSGLSLAHLVICLMHKQMRYRPEDPWDGGSDRLILSEGHAVPIVYAAYADLGGAVGKNKSESRRLTPEDLNGLREIDSVLDGHPNPAEGFPFFDAATGSLGQGLSAACGLALAARLDGLDRKFYVLIGDGESREGQVWEACDFLIDNQLTNICPIFNGNGQGQADYVSPQQSAERNAAKLRAYGFEVFSVDGHDPTQILNALKNVGGRAPVAVVAKTVKGWASPSLQTAGNHGKPVPKDDLPKVLSELEKSGVEMGVAQGTNGLKPTPNGKSHQPAPLKSVRLPSPEFSKWVTGFEKKPRLGTRKAYGYALRELGKLSEQIVALDADVSNSTFANLFAKEFPDRFFECKIAEQNMVSAGVGMAAAGKVPFISSFAKFIARAYDQVEMAVITRANIKITGSHSGVSLAADGPSQMSLPDIAYFRALATGGVDAEKNWSVACLHPSDAIAAYRLTELMANHHGLCYMRTHRPDLPLLYPADEKFEIGGHKVLRKGDALAIAASGYMVHESLAAAEKLNASGLATTVLDCYSFPLDGAAVLDAIGAAGGKCLVVEDNFTGGGLAEAIACAAAESGQQINLKVMGVKRIPKSGKTPDEIMRYLGLSVDDIVAAGKSLGA